MNANDGQGWTEVASGVTLTSFTQTGLSDATTYQFKVRARNGIGYSSYSTILNALTASVPSQPNAPTTSLITDEEISVSWSEPSDLGGLTITAYVLKIKTSTETYEVDVINCDATSDTIINARTCTIPVATLKAAPFNLEGQDNVIAVVTAVNAVGESPVSNEGYGANIPICVDDATCGYESCIEYDGVGVDIPLSVEMLTVSTIQMGMTIPATSKCTVDMYERSHSITNR